MPCDTWHVVGGEHILWKFHYFHLQRSKFKLVYYKPILREKFGKDIGLRISKLCSEMIKNLFANLWVFATHCWWVKVKISSSILLCIMGESAGGASAAVAVAVSDIWQSSAWQYNAIHAVHWSNLRYTTEIQCSNSVQCIVYNFCAVQWCSVVQWIQVLCSTVQCST